MLEVEEVAGEVVDQVVMVEQVVQAVLDFIINL
jgi:hypothetical protein